jgi:hypothetical protein
VAQEAPVERPDILEGPELTTIVGDIQICPLQHLVTFLPSARVVQGVAVSVVIVVE